MKKFFFAAISAAILFSCNSKKEENKDDKTNGTEKPADKTADNKTASAPLDSTTKAKNMQEYMTPGPVHKMMASWDGTWNGEVTMWMEPGAPPMTATMTSTNKMIFNGLYQESDNVGTMMGMPFHGKSTMGYDNHTKKFISNWIDNMGSGMMRMEGPWDEATKSVTLKGSGINPETKENCEVKEIFKIVDDNTQMMEMYRTDNGKEFKTMEIKLTRKK